MTHIDQKTMHNSHGLLDYIRHTYTRKQYTTHMDLLTTYDTHRSENNAQLTWTYWLHMTKIYLKITHMWHILTSTYWHFIWHINFKTTYETNGPENDIWHQWAIKLWHTWIWKLCDVHGPENCMTYMDLKTVWHTWTWKLYDVHGPETCMTYMDLKTVWRTWTWTFFPMYFNLSFPKQLIKTRHLVI